jgi:alpha-tubulin suppressor-like RCC1 family protein
LALTSEGEVYAWGENASGQCGVKILSDGDFNGKRSEKTFVKSTTFKRTSGDETKSEGSDLGESKSKLKDDDTKSEVSVSTASAAAID